MDALDRYVLGLAVLEGDRSARAILSDLLIESGELGLAQWARKCGAKDRDRLEFAIMLLPCEKSIVLGERFTREGGDRIYEFQPGEFFRIYKDWRYSVLDLRQQQLAPPIPFDPYRSRFDETINSFRAALARGLGMHVGHPNFPRKHWLLEVACAFCDAVWGVHEHIASSRTGDGKANHWRLFANEKVRITAKYPYSQPAKQRLALVLEAYQQIVNAGSVQTDDETLA